MCSYRWKITVITNQNNELIAYYCESNCQEQCMGPADENSHILLSDSSPGPSVVIRRWSVAGETQWPRHVVLGGAAGGAAGFASRRVATWLCSRRSAGAKNKQPHLAPVSLSGSTSEAPSMKNTRLGVEFIFKLWQRLLLFRSFAVWGCDSWGSQVLFERWFSAVPSPLPLLGHC